MKYKYNGQWVELSIKALDGMVIGTIVAFAGTTIPTGWLECNGATITQSEYPDLYALIGGTLPNLKGRTIVGQNTSDTDFDTLGETGGEKTHILTTQEMPIHNHYGIYNESLTAEIMGGWGSGSHTGILSEMAANTFDHLRTGNSGEGKAHNNLQPYAVYKWIIKAKNTTPTMASVVNATNSSTTDTYSCDYVNKDNTYSTSEIKTNKVWIDGKPIYRKVINASNIGTAFSTTISNIDNLFFADNSRISWNFNVGSYPINRADFYFNKSNNTIEAQNSAVATWGAELVLEYTKTTD